MERQHIRDGESSAPFAPPAAAGDMPIPDLGSGGAGVVGHSRRILAAIVDGSEDAIFAKDLDGVIRTWNDGAQRIYEYTPEEIIGCNVSRLVPPDVESDVPEIISRLRRGDTIEQYETERMTKSGRRLRVSLTISPLRDEDGEVVGASTIARDVTALRRAEARRSLVEKLGEALAPVLDEEEVLRRLARASVGEMSDYCVAYLVSANGEIRRVGLAHADRAKEQLVRRLGDARAPSIDDTLGAGAVIRTGEPILATEIREEDLERAAGEDRAYLRLLLELRPISSMILPLRARGRTVGAVALATTAHSGMRYDREDLTFASDLADRAALGVDNARLFSEARMELERRRAAEAELRRRYEQLRAVYRMTEAVARAEVLEEIYHEAIHALLEGVPVDRASVLRFDPEGVLRFVAWSGLSDGYRERVEGHSPWSPDTRDAEPIVIADVADAPDLEEELRDAILSEGIRALAFFPLAFGGKLLGKFMLYFDEARDLASEEIELARTISGTIGFAIMRVEDEQRVRAAKEAAERANQVKSQFLGVMSHELRTPLNSVVGYADLLLMEAKGPLNPQQQEYVRRIKDSAGHQLALVEEILSYARIEAGREEVHRVPTDVCRSIRDVMEFVRPEAERKGVDLRSDLPDGPVQTLTDPARLRQILLNLAGNATKFTRKGEVVVRARLDGPMITVEVEDTGPGIPPDHVDRIWEPFTQGDGDPGRESGGTGLGLAIARRLAELLGGALTVSSRPGEGSTFTLGLPQDPPAAAGSA